MHTRRPLDHRLQRNIARLAAIIQTDPQSLFAFTMRRPIFTLHVSSPMSARVGASPVLHRVGRHERVAAHKTSPDHAAERQVGRDDAQMQLRVRPDGGDAVVVRQVRGPDAQGRRAHNGDGGGDEAQGHESTHADFGPGRDFDAPEYDDGEQGADKVCNDRVCWFHVVSAVSCV
jgi:hypothetical protein